MKPILLLLFLFAATKMFPQCNINSKVDGIIFVPEENSAASIQFNLSGNLQIAFKDASTGAYKYSFREGTVIDPLKDISFNSALMISPAGVSAQEIDGKCFKVVLLTKGLELEVTCNINYVADIDKKRTSLPTHIPVLPTEKKVVEIQIDEYKYVYVLNIKTLKSSTNQSIEHSDTDIKRIIAENQARNSLEAGMIMGKKIRIKKIVYQLNN